MSILLNKFFGLFSKDLGIDLGTANTLVYVKDKGIVINEPSVVAINQKTGQVLAIGSAAKNMVGRTPAHIVALRPLVNGVISDFEVTEQMLKYFFNKAHEGKFNFMPRPRVVAAIPSGVTEVEKKAVIDAAKNAGAREVFLIEEPIAAALGARLPIQEALASMIVDIGGGTTEVAVISLGGIVLSKSLRIAGDKLNEDIIQYARDEFNLLLGERTAENIKIAVGSTEEQEELLEAPMRGRDIVTGLPKEIIVNDVHIRKAMNRSVKFLVDAIRSTVEETPPELLADLMSHGIILAGGGSLLRGLANSIQKETKISVTVADDPLTAVVRGTGFVLEKLDELAEILVDTDNLESPK
ncbi:MAG: rod shape-determining protein [Parcubacteria group bacterium GW2011_GWA2_38_13b]|nr:MAG: rod shape-determining protein [Parcubacteria group bacterium GW2011_GWA2_38_13b]